MTQHFEKWAKWLSQLNEQPKQLKKNLKNSILTTGNRTLIYAMTGRNASAIKSIKPTGEQAIVSSWYTRWWKLHERKYMK